MTSCERVRAVVLGLEGGQVGHSHRFGRSAVHSRGVNARAISGQRGAGTSYSTDWAGYVAAGLYSSYVSSVQTEFTIPSIYTGSGYRVSSLWAGLGSATLPQDPLIQAGVEIDTYWINGVNYYGLLPFWEVYPNIQYEVPVGLSIQAHDSVGVVISNYSTYSSFWMEDATSGQATSWTANYSCLCTQLEAIEEHTQDTNGDNMTFLGPASFVNTGGRDGAAFYWIGTYNTLATTALGPTDGKTLAYPGPLGYGTGNITDYRTSND